MCRGGNSHGRCHHSSGRLNCFSQVNASARLYRSDWRATESATPGSGWGCPRFLLKATDSADSSQIERFTIQIDDANEAPIKVAGMVDTTEDVYVVVTLNGIDIDARDSIEMMRIEQVPRHGQLMMNGKPVELGEEISFSEVNSGGLSFVADKDWHGDTRLSFSVFDGETWSADSAEVSIHVEAVADGASLTMEPARGLAGETIPLQFAATTPDLDGSEQVSILIAGLPEGAKFSAGNRQADGTWLLGSTDLSSLMLTLPQGQAQRFVLAITATTTEDSGSASTTTAMLHVTVDASLSIAPVSSPPTEHQAQAFDSTVSENGERHIGQTASITEFTKDLPSRESAVVPDRPVDDMFITIRN